MVDEVIRVDVKKVVADITLAVLLQCLVIIIPIYAVPLEMVFSCQDTSLMYPYVESTISRRTGMIALPGAVLLVLILLEWLNPSYNRKVLFGKFRIPTFAYNVYCTIGIFFFGQSSVQMTVVAFHYFIGRPRPYFLTLCQPDVCQSSNGSQSFAYYKTFTCMNPSYNFNENDLSLMRTSFPSGHAVLAAFCSVYLAVYFQKKITTRYSKLFKHILQLGVLLIACYMSATRMLDHKHHWEDILSGLFIGAVGAIITVTYVAPTSKNYHAIKTDLIQ